MLEGRAVGLVPRVPPTSGASCIKAPLSAENDFSYYTFHIDAAVKNAAATAGLTKIGVRQHCNSNGGLFGMTAANTENWAYVPLDKFGPENKYKVKVDRCKKDYDRHVWSYSVWLCNDSNWCGTTNCGLDREICPAEKTKSVDLADTLVWTCSV
ncbi:hatching enzyme [Colletotrichum tofieldiae]|nr:hatching enzyme [Colletotrichum tofieldiae]